MNTTAQTGADLSLENDADCPLLHQFFERAAARFPEAIAVDVPPGAGRNRRIQLTYAELDRHASVLARRLQAIVTGECVVAIRLPRNSAMLVTAQLAALKAGAAFTCIDPAASAARIGEILDDARAVALVTDAEGAQRVHAGEGALPPNVIDVEAALSVLDQPNPAGPARVAEATSPASLAYVVYTSGTTGRPKGVMIEHRAIVNLVRGDLAEFRLGVGDRVAQGSSAAYDSSIEETWLALAAGATLVVMDEQAVRSGPDLVDWLRAERIHVFCPPPTLLRASGCEDPLAALPDLKILYVGGEALPQDLADRWARGRRMVNGYGPTECAVTCLRSEVRPGEAVRIGRPVPGQKAWILDASLAEVPDGEPGELCIGGAGLARGYRNRDDLTAAKFIDHPQWGRIYRTGDRVRREADGEIAFEGRTDAQVKIRGYRIELSGIEARLLECAGVREAACRVQDEGGKPVLAAFVVPIDASRPPEFASIKVALAEVLPDYMVPSRFGLLAALPTSVGGKLDRAALPWLGAAAPDASGSRVAPRNALETRLVEAFRSALALPAPVSIDDDFFTVLGGDSLGAAILVTALREHESTAWVTVRDIYEARTVAALAARVPGEPAQAALASAADRTGAWPFLVTLAQALWLLALFGATSIATYLVAFVFFPAWGAAWGLLPMLVLTPLVALLAFAAYAPLAVLFAVALKRLLIGRYRPLRAPVWGGYYLRNWIVQQAVRMIPWSALEGTSLQLTVLRALGARIGRRVHLHRGVNLLRGGWDLLEIGDDVTLNHSAALQLVDLDDGQIVFAPVRLGNGSTLEIRAVAGGDTVLEDGARLCAMSWLAPGMRIGRGERWDGIPAHPAGPAPLPPPLPACTTSLSPFAHGLRLGMARAAIVLLIALPAELLAVGTCLALDISAADFGRWLAWPASGWMPWAIGLGLAALAVPATLLFEAVLMRALGRVPTGAIDRWGSGYIRVWLKAEILESAGRWLSGTLLWPVWLRAAGMQVRQGCEISTIIDVIPEHVAIGEESFFADGIYLGGPQIHRGVVTLAPTRLGRNTFLGNHVVIPAGQTLPDAVLLGVCTVAQPSMNRPATGWFGVPPFELPRREVVSIDRRLTHDPSAIR
ncbi:MAG TPA: amino acid adenylation domain-containing protein, partial [Usitatibacteraceae bacterium]|nr:amino acid adenylation domain-containing protein [Usitatibacteraceae bacterium]